MELVDTAAVDKAVTHLEAALLKYKRNGFGVDLPESSSDPSRTDPIFAAAVMKLLIKYGDKLVISRFRQRAQIAWRVSAFSVVQEENRKALEGVGFFTVNDVDDIGGVDPGGVGMVSAEEIEAKRKKRVEEWRAKGWKGVMDAMGNFVIPPEEGVA